MEYPLVVERAGGVSVSVWRWWLLTTRLSGAEVELWPLPQQLPPNIARV